MNDFYTVKEVCDITGLTPKLVNDYHEQGIVKATAHRSTGRVDRDGKVYQGYKVYDEDALIKLHQAAIFRQLGLSRAEIKKILTASDYDSNRVLDEQIEMLKKKKEEIDQMIAAAESIKALGMKNNALHFANIKSVFNLARLSEIFERSSLYQQMMSRAEELEKVFADEDEGYLFDEALTEDNVNELFGAFIEAMGAFGYLFLGYSVFSCIGEGELATELGMSGKDAAIIFDYIMKDIDEVTVELKAIEIKYKAAIGVEYSEPVIIEMIEAVKEILERHFGIKTKEEFEFIALIKQEANVKFHSSETEYIYNAVKYHVLDT